MKKLVLFLIIMMILSVAAPAAASVSGLLARNGEGSYYFYGYQQLLDSYALKLINKPNGLYENYLSNSPVAFLHSSGVLVDYSDTIDYYAALVITGQKFNFNSFVQSAGSKKVEAPLSYTRVSVSQGQLNFQKFGDGNSKSSAFINHTPAPVHSGAESNQGSETAADSGRETIPEGVPIVAPSRVSLPKALEWAESKNAHPRFIEIAPLYWEYGRLTGICPEVLYAQAAHETRFGHFGGQVPPSYNNWAGIKTANAAGDRPEDHQQFATPEEGVRAHYNHMAAYVGLNPIGETHNRYYVVKNLYWAGTVKTVEELSGKWAPSATYHQRIVRFLTEMKQ